MKKGDKGHEVKALQMKLNKILDISLVLDGDFGAKTEKAVKVFQSSYAPVQSGVVSDFLLHEIDSKYAELISKLGTMTDAFNFALKYYGLKEIKGNVHEPIIIDMFAEIGHKWVLNDELAWCSTFANFVCKMTGYEYTGKLNARSWLEVGIEVEVPKLGDIVVFWRNGIDSAFGHVGQYVNETETHIYVLGGNQSNMVRISAYPKNRVLSIRRMSKIK